MALRDYWIARAEVETLLAGRLPEGAAMAAGELSAAPSSPRGGH
jgi:hypothetical protein